MVKEILIQNTTIDNGERGQLRTGKEKGNNVVKGSFLGGHFYLRSLRNDPNLETNCHYFKRLKSKLLD